MTMPINSNTQPKEVTAVPAYGRHLKSKDAVLDSWNKNQDFQIVGMQGNGTYINKQDADRYGVSVRIRYDKKKKVLTIKPQDNDTE